MAVRLLRDHKFPPARGTVCVAANPVYWQLSQIGVAVVLGRGLARPPGRGQMASIPDEATQRDQPKPRAKLIDVTDTPEAKSLLVTGQSAPPSDESKPIRFQFPQGATGQEMLDAVKEMRGKARGEE